MSWKAARETFGFLGVIASLVFVGMEINQNTVAARADAYQSLGLALSEMWLDMAHDPVLADLNARFFEEPQNAAWDGWTETELNVLIRGWLGGLRQLETAWRQINLGLLEPEILQSFGWDAAIFGGTAGDNMALLWPRIDPYMSPDFAAFVEASLLSGEPGVPAP